MTELVKPGGVDVDVSGVSSDVALVTLWLDRDRSDATRRAYAADAEWWLARLPPLRELRLEDVRQARAELTGQPSTQARRIAALRSLLRFGHELEYLPRNVGALLTQPKAPRRLAERMLGVEELGALLNAANARGGRDRAIVLTLYYSAARVAEVAGLTWDRVHREETAGKPDGASLTVHGKGGLTRSVWVPEVVWIALSAIAPEPREGHVFRARAGTPLDVRDFRRRLTLAARDAGLGKVSPHWLRHTAATLALRAGCPLHEVSADLGHASIATTGRYLHARKSSGLARFLQS
jgi:integrase/recombinase XerD